MYRLTKILFLQAFCDFLLHLLRYNTGCGPQQSDSTGRTLLIMSSISCDDFPIINDIFYPRMILSTAGFKTAQMNMRFVASLYDTEYVSLALSRSPGGND